jgi:hypothetical protein
MCESCSLQVPDQVVCQSEQITSEPTLNTHADHGNSTRSYKRTNGQILNFYIRIRDYLHVRDLALDYVVPAFRVAALPSKA